MDDSFSAIRRVIFRTMMTRALPPARRQSSYGHRHYGQRLKSFETRVGIELPGITAPLSIRDAVNRKITIVIERSQTSDVCAMRWHLPVERRLFENYELG
jgi:hypothetical protein